jgi:hypothetical protein
VALAGSMGSKALLVIDGQPRHIGGGPERHAGVRLLQLDDGEAQVRTCRQHASLRCGGRAGRLAGTPQAATTARRRSCCRRAGRALHGQRRHQRAAGAVHGRYRRHVVALSQAEAERIGLDYRSAPRAVSQTANGPCRCTADAECGAGHGPELHPGELAFREEIREWVADNLPADISHKVHNALRLSRDDMQRWAKILGKKGWLGYGWPKQFGGPGWNAVQKHLFEEECAWPARRASCPSAR